MPVRDLHQKRHLPLQPECVDNIGKFTPEFFGEENDADTFVSENIFQSLPQFVALMYHHTVHSREAHSGVSINVIAYEKHFHIKLPPVYPQ